MLDFIRSRASGLFAKVVLGIIILLFALGGIDTWLNQAGNSIAIAKVGQSEISIQEYGNALETVRNRMQQSGEKIDPAMLASTEFKTSVLDGLVTRRLVDAEIKRANFKISDEQLSQHITSMPEFQKDGKFSQELYDKTLEQNKLTAAKFEQSIRGDLVTQQARDGLARLVMTPNNVAESALQYSYQQREVSTAEIKSAQYINQVKVTPDQVQAYYNLHKDKFKAPEQVKLEFALLTAAGFVSQMTATEAEIQEFYDTNKAKFQGNEQRSASHILIAYGVGATDKEKADAKAKALDVLSQVKKTPNQFEELAIKYSQDPGSAPKGGDLGSFGRGAMVKPFEDKAFSLKKDQISDLVESEFGFHIIRVNEITGASSAYADMKPQIKGDILFLKAQAKYAELTEDFSNTVYEQSGSLQPVAKKFNIQLQTTPWMSREDGTKFFQGNTKIMAAAFAPEAVKEKRNTEAIEVAPNNLVSVRVVDYKAAAPRTFDEVKGGIEALLKLEAAMKLAQMQGEADLKRLNAGQEADLEWIPAVTVGRKNAEGLSDAVMKQVFKINANKLPAYAGFVDENKAYVIVQVLNVKNTLQDNVEAKKNAEMEYQAAVAAEYMTAHGKSLKAKTEVVVDRKLLIGDSNQ